MVDFNAYFTDSLKGVLTNQFLMGIYLSAIVFTLRSYWEKNIYKNEMRNIKKILLEVLFFIFIIPASLFVLTFFIFIFWLISFTQN